MDGVFGFSPVYLQKKCATDKKGETAKNIVLQYQKVPNIFDPLLKKMMLPYNFDGMLKILNEYLEAGKSGKQAGEGFYKYNK